MELKEFISQTIREIVEGMAASEQCSDLGVIVNPAVTLGENGDFFIPNDIIKAVTTLERRVQLIHMDVLVSISETSALDNQVKASIKVLGANVNGKTEGNTVNSNRVSFDIPVCLPVSENK